MILTQYGLRRKSNYFRRLVFGIALIFSPAGAVLPSQWDREAARRSWEEASRLREALQAAPAPTRDRYLECARTYQQVYKLDAHSGFSDDAIYEAGALFQEMGEKFGQSGDFKSAAALYRFLSTDYPGSPRCPAALLRLAAISEGPLADSQAARNARELLRTRYPKSSEAAAAEFPRAEPAEKAAPPPDASADAVSAPRSGGGPTAIKEVRFWSNRESTRVSIVSDGGVRYTKNRLENPDRVFFDITGARLDRQLASKIFSVEDRFVKQVRIGQNRPDVVRVVLDLGNEGNYSVVDVAETFGINIEIRTQGKPALQPAPPPKAAATPSAAIAEARKPDAGKSDLKSEARPDPKPAVVSPPPAAMSGPPAVTRTASGPPPGPAKGAQPETAGIAKETPPNAPGGTPRDPARTNIPPAPALPDPAPLPKIALPTSKGDRTLTRTLGLKIGRIVVDPGHGGHDTGTVGPGGLMEKDLVLKLAKELKRLLEDKLSAEVVLTRSDDVFVSLEDRTRIANESEADLFISLHANSSRSRNVSGVETYFLDFARTDEARELAARENATSERNIRDLQNLIEKIALADRQEESKEFASIVQKNLYTGARKVIPASKNRGVRSAPFIVLIGARMPSILAEVSFLSNPRDERALNKASGTQAIASALFQGIEGYMKALGKAISQNQKGTIGGETQQKRICQLSFVNWHLGARQVGSALGYFARSERDQDRTGRRFAAARRQMTIDH